jgi:hypothetical protein
MKFERTVAKGVNPLRPVSVSNINPLYDDKGGFLGWGLTVTYDGHNGSPLHVGGARVNIKNVEKHTLAEYHFPESIANRGFERAYVFRDALLKQIAIRNMEK